MSTIKKALVGLVGAVLTWGLTAHLPDGSIDRAEWWGLAVAVATALGIYATPNGPQKVEIVGEPVVVEDVNERGAVDPGSAAVGFLVALALVVLIATLEPR